MLSRQPRQTDEEPRRRSRTTRIVAVLVVVFVLYLLSFGPALALVMHYENESVVTVFRAAYVPLGALADVTGTGSYLEAYGKWWFNIMYGQK